MDIKKLAPWNWFKKEDESASSVIPVQHKELRSSGSDIFARHPLFQLHRAVDRIFEDACKGFAVSPPGRGVSPQLSNILKPQVDIGATDREYTVSVEVPGVGEDDVKVEISDSILSIRGEKMQETEMKEHDFYRVERSYGSFQRILDLPDDADQAEISARFNKGVLLIRIPRKAVPKSDVKRIEIKKAA